jgi:hypothetical protein
VGRKIGREGRGAGWAEEQRRMKKTRREERDGEMV